MAGNTIWTEKTLYSNDIWRHNLAEKTLYSDEGNDYSRIKRNNLEESFHRLSQ
jgi:hypothetical protein